MHAIFVRSTSSEHLWVRRGIFNIGNGNLHATEKSTGFEARLTFKFLSTKLRGFSSGSNFSLRLHHSANDENSSLRCRGSCNRVTTIKNTSLYFTVFSKAKHKPQIRVTHRWPTTRLPFSISYCGAVLFPPEASSWEFPRPKCSQS